MSRIRLLGQTQKFKYLKSGFLKPETDINLKKWKRTTRSQIALVLQLTNESSWNRNKGKIIYYTKMEYDVVYVDVIPTGFININLEYVNLLC